MRPSPRPLALLAACLAAGGCAAPSALPPAPAPAAPVSLAATSAAAPAAATGLIAGLARGPKGVVGAVLPVGGGHVLPVGGGNVLPTGGGNVLPSGAGRFALAAVAEAPLANATVFLADAAGNPYPSLPAVATDAEGRFTLEDVPAGHTFMVVVAARDARGQAVTLQTLVRSSELGATAAVDTASSLVTLAVTEGAGDRLGAFNAAAFRTATEATARGLVEGELPDLADRSAILAKVDALASAVAELRTALDALRQDIQDIKDSLAELKAQVAARPPVPPPAPGGFNGGARPGDCAPAQTYRFKLKGAWEGYPLRVDFVSPHGHLMAQIVFDAPGAPGTGRLPTGCPHAITLRDARGTVLATDPAWSIPLGSSAGADLELPF